MRLARRRRAAPAPGPDTLLVDAGLARQWAGTPCPELMLLVEPLSPAGPAESLADSETPCSGSILGCEEADAAWPAPKAASRPHALLRETMIQGSPLHRRGTSPRICHPAASEKRPRPPPGIAARRVEAVSQGAASPRRSRSGEAAPRHAAT